MSTDAAEVLINTSMIPSSLTRGVSAGPKAVLRARAFVAGLLMRMQIIGLAAMFAAFGTMVRRDDGSENDNIIVVSVSHSWDETKQLLRESVRRPGMEANPFMKQPRQRIGKNVMVQSSMVHAVGVLATPGGHPHIYHKAESYLHPPLELAGKSASFVGAAILRRLAVPLDNPEELRELCRRVTALVVTLWGDSASTNRRFLRHACGLAEKDGVPSNLLVDPGQRCLLHQLHRVKTRVLEGHSLVSLAYCFSRLIRSGNVLGAVADTIINYIEKNCQRICQPPPAEAVRRTREVFDRLYNLEASHHLLHTTRGTKRSELVKDIEFLMRMDPTIADRSDMIHFCWDDTSGKPCCNTREQSVQKMTATYCNLFLCHGVPSGSLSRWTHVGMMFVLLSTSFLCRDLFVKAVMANLHADPNAELAANRLEPGAAGAGDSDYMVERSARIQKVRGWLARPVTRLQVGVMFFLTSMLDSVMYHIMGGQTADGARSRKPGTTPRLDEPLPTNGLIAEVRSCLARLADFLAGWSDDSCAPAVVLDAMGASAAARSSPESLRFVRRQCLGYSAGVFRRLALRLAAFPAQLWVLADSTVSEQVRRAAATTFFELPPCCVGAFGRRFRRLPQHARGAAAPGGQDVGRGMVTKLGVVDLPVRERPRQLPQVDAERLCASSQLCAGGPRAVAGVQQDAPH